MALQRSPERGCRFLNWETKKCTIYEARPLLCRLYPFKLKESRDGEFKGFGLHKDVGCPKNKDGVVVTKPLYELYVNDDENQDDYNDLVEFFNSDKYKDKTPFDFVKLFIKGLHW